MDIDSYPDEELPCSARNCKKVRRADGKTHTHRVWLSKATSYMREWFWGFHLKLCFLSSCISNVPEQPAVKQGRSCCGVTGLSVSWQCQDTGSIPRLAQGVQGPGVAVAAASVTAVAQIQSMAGEFHMLQGSPKREKEKRKQGRPNQI